MIRYGPPLSNNHPSFYGEIFIFPQKKALARRGLPPHPEINLFPAIFEPGRFGPGWPVEGLGG